MANLEKAEKLTKAEKASLVKNLITKVNKKAGKTIIGTIADNADIQDRLKIKWIPTACPDLNEAVGGGFPKRRCTIIAGAEDSGKTSLVLETIGKNMAKDPDFYALWIESEDSLDSDYITNTHKIDPERLTFIPVDNGISAEEVLDIVYECLKTGVYDLCCINSLKALVPTQEAEASLNNSVVAVQARMNSRMTRKFTPIIAEFETAFIIITHLSTDIGSMSRDPMIISGGRAIKYWSSLTLDLRKRSIGPGEPITKEEGVKIGVTVKKNHVCPTRFPYRKVDYYAIFGEGIETIFSSLSAAVNKGVCKIAGAWVQWLNPDGTIREKWNGQAKFRKYMVEHPDVFEEFASLVYGGEKLSEEEVEEIKLEESELDELIDGETTEEMAG